MTCGYHVEDTEHFLLYCPLHQVSHQRMMQNIVRINIIFNIDVDVLLYINEENSLLTNTGIFSAVHTFISEFDRL